MIQFACSACGCGLQTTNEKAGKKTRCPSCSELLRIPAASPPSPDGSATEARTVAHSNTQPEGSGKAGPAVVLGYELLDELGRGGMGVVYKARQLRPRRLVALKMILAAEHAGPEALARFTGEAEAVARLAHANIVQIYEVGEHEGRPFLILELVDGGNLAQKLLRKKLGFQETADLVLQIARAVQFAHKHGIIHRDLKPANILLSRSRDTESASGRSKFVPKITDFGLAKQLDETSSMAPAGARTQSGSILGTPAYMAPEQAEGKTRNIGKPADIYSVGAILYECLTGQPPFEAPTMLDTLIKVATEEPPPPRQLRPKCPRDLETICLKCMQKDPRDRYASAADLAADLRRYLDDEPIKARPAGKLRSWGRALKRHKELAFLAGGAVLAFALVLPLVIYFLPSSKHPDSGSVVEQDPPAEDLPEDEESATSRPQLTAQRMQSQNNMKQFTIAMHNFAASNNGNLPPAAITNPQTRQPLLSWRVALLPYLEQANLYRQFKLNEPWDGPNNKKLLALMPKVFEVPGGKPSRPDTTFYQVFVGPQALFEPVFEKRLPATGFAGHNIGTIPDGTSNTILMAEAAEAVPWTKPADLVFTPKGPLPRLGGHFGDGFNVGMADGSVRFVSSAVSDRTLRGAITRNGGEVLGPDWLSGTGNSPRSFGEAVSGKITYKGIPLTGGTIRFHGLDRQGDRSGPIRKDGSYKIERLVLGAYVVTLTAEAGAKRRIPEKYADVNTSPVRHTVRGTAPFSIELKD